jgi:6-phosphogluconolactonase
MFAGGRVVDRAEDVKVFSDLAALSQAAADYFVREAMAAVTTYGRFLVILSGGSTPQELYRLLAGPPYREQVPWLQTHLYWADERLVPPGDPGSNYGQVEQLLINQVTIPPQNVHRIKGELEAAAAVADYTWQLEQLADKGAGWPRFDLVLLGLGADGHTASLFPGRAPAEAWQQPVVAVTAAYQGRPAQRVTVTPPVFNSARRILFLVSGSEKAKALAAVRQEQNDAEEWPARMIQPQEGAVTWLIDQAAANQS